MIESVYFDDDTNKAQVTYKLSDEDVEVLSHMKEHGYMEFKQSDDSNIINNLYDAGLVTYDEDAWHQTYVLTNLGNQVAEARLRH